MPRRALGSLQDLVEIVASWIVVGQVPVQELRVAADRGEHVVEVVRHAAGKLTERFELLGLTQLRFESELPGDVPRVHDDSAHRMRMSQVGECDDEVPPFAALRPDPDGTRHAHAALAPERGELLACIVEIIGVDERPRIDGRSFRCAIAEDPSL